MSGASHSARCPWAGEIQPVRCQGKPAHTEHNRALTLAWCRDEGVKARAAGWPIWRNPHTGSWADNWFAGWRGATVVRNGHGGARAGAGRVSS